MKIYDRSKENTKEGDVMELCMSNVSIYHQNLVGINLRLIPTGYCACCKPHKQKRNKAVRGKRGMYEIQDNWKQKVVGQMELQPCK